MKEHFCPAEQSMIAFEKECNWCGEREALAQTQEPVGQLLEDAFGRGQVMWFNKPKDKSMLYTTPPQRTEQNFCSRCGKRTNDIHTCTPPQD